MPSVTIDLDCHGVPISGIGVDGHPMGRDRVEEAIGKIKKDAEFERVGPLTYKYFDGQVTYGVLLRYQVEMKK